MVRTSGWLKSLAGIFQQLTGAAKNGGGLGGFSFIAWSGFYSKKHYFN